MANGMVVESDLSFRKGVIAAGAKDVKKCYQCATCSVACPVTPDNDPYPRKEMIWAQWGLKDRLLNDPDLWLCHYCNDCSVQCPRGANPGELMNATRRLTIRENSWPSFLGRLVGSSTMMFLTISIPIVVVLLLIYISGRSFPVGPVKYSGDSISHPDGFIYLPALQVVFSISLLFAITSLLLSLRNYWSSLWENNPIEITTDRKPFVASLIEALKEILPHTTFKECETNNVRYVTHLLVFWGMVGLFLTTAIVAFNYDILGLKPPSQNGPWTIPIKILGNLSAIVFVVGLCFMLIRRLSVPDQTGAGSYFDWFFLIVIFGTGVTGLLTELARLSGLAHSAYVLYSIHLMFALALMLYLPYSKFAHLGYRTVAITWAKSSGRNVTFSTAPNYIHSAAESAASGGSTDSPRNPLNMS